MDEFDGYTFKGSQRSGELGTSAVSSLACSSTGASGDFIGCVAWSREGILALESALSSVFSARWRLISFRYFSIIESSGMRESALPKIASAAEVTRTRSLDSRFSLFGLLARVACRAEMLSDFLRIA